MLAYVRVLFEMRPCRFAALVPILFAIICSVANQVLAGLPGQEIYLKQCAECHGTTGQGVADKYDESLSGDLSLAELTKVIAETMPKDAPEKLTPEATGEVASYVYETFYSPDAISRQKPARVELSRLTVRQYGNVAADLLSGFRGKSEIGEQRGLEAQYFNARNLRRDKRVIERIDDKVDFSYGDKSPDAEKIGVEEFAARWEGSLIVEESGEYELCAKSENGIRLWVNDRDKPLIDGWVASGGEVVEHKASVGLLAGRVYPIRLEFFKFKDKSASVALKWKPPHKAWEVIPKRHLSPNRTPASIVITSPFPPDDSSVGYERGTSISKAWEKATTSAAIEIVDYVVRNSEDLTGAKPDADDRKEKYKAFCYKLAERAFRRPLADEQKQFFVDTQFERMEDPEIAMRRALLLVLKSPRFLYTELREPDKPADDYDVASRLSFALWDSLPDDELLKAAAAGQLRTPEQVAQQAQRMLADSRARAKANEFFHAWLPFDEGEEISKDGQAFPGFGEEVVADLRTSLQLFLDRVVWSESSDFRELILADYWYVNDRLAKFYGLSVPEDGEFHKVTEDAKLRAGIVTHPYLLSALAYHKSSSPIHRGVFATRKLLGRALKPPPMAIQFMDGRFDPSMTMREKVTELTSSNACQTCHSVINPLGFSLEHFDAVGRFRSVDQQKPIDATGEFTSVTGETIKLTGARDLAEFAARSPEAQRGFVEQLFEHVVKHPVRAFGEDRLDRLTESFGQSNYNVQKLLLEIATTAALGGVAGNTGAVAQQ